MNGFTRFGLDPRLERGIRSAGFTDPRPVQKKTIGAAMSGRDILGLAQTGTGKTAAFAIPLIDQMLAGRSPAPRALIIAPTRELVQQICNEISLLARYTKVRAITIFGGVGVGAQALALRKRPDILVACPGRLLDLYGRGMVDLSRIETLVLDEADHLFDMGFLPDIRRILNHLPEDRQDLLFSATMPKEVRGLAEGILKDPHVVELANSQPAETIEHALYPVAQKRKCELLLHLVKEDEFKSAIVFLRTKHRARRLAKDLQGKGLNATCLQGNMSHAQRERAMRGFRTGRFDILVATDIAARGIDVAGISHVINYDIPDTPDAYTHRIGRTGRSELTGKACTFVTSEDYDIVRSIEKRIGSSIERCVVRGFEGEEEPRHRRKASGGHGRANGRKPQNSRRRSSSRPGKDVRKANRAAKGDAPSSRSSSSRPRKSGPGTNRSDRPHESSARHGANGSPKAKRRRPAASKSGRPGSRPSRAKSRTSRRRP